MITIRGGHLEGDWRIKMTNTQLIHSMQHHHRRVYKVIISRDHSNGLRPTKEDQDGLR